MMKPIETIYKGYRFRSRLEARWAVFFDAAGFQWEYEPQGFATAAGPYLPDFRVRVGPVAYWYEIKPVHVASDAKQAAFAQHLDEEREEGRPETFQYATLLSGDPVEASADVRLCMGCGFIHAQPIFYRWCDDVRVTWYCAICDGPGHYFQGFGELGRWYQHGNMICFQSGVMHGINCVRAAQDAARRARFEHRWRP